jgi:hypothetical protein
MTRQFIVINLLPEILTWSSSLFQSFWFILPHTAKVRRLLYRWAGCTKIVVVFVGSLFGYRT